MLQIANESPLLLDLYGCCNGRTSWEAALERMCTQFNCMHFMVQKLSIDGPRLKGNLKLSNDYSSFPQYERVISDINNPRLERKRLLERARDKIVVNKQLFNSEELTEKQLFLDKLSGLGCGDFMGGITQLEKDNSYLGIAMHRATESPEPFSQAEQLQLQAFLPHLRQAFMMWEQLNTQSPLETIFKAQADHYPFGMIICDPTSRAHWMNSAAEIILPQPLGARHSKSNLRCWTLKQTEYLQRRIAAATPDNPADYILVKSDTTTDVHIAIKSFKEPESGHTYVLLILSSTEIINEIPFEALQALFGLTQAEARLASHLARGGTPDAYALQQDIAITTVRWHIKQILSKTESRRQSELVQKILCSVAYHACRSNNSLPR